VLEWWAAISDEINARIASHRRLVLDALSWPLDEAWAERVRTTFGSLPDSSAAGITALARQNESTRQGFIMHSSDLLAADIYHFDCQELAALYPDEAPLRTLCGLLESWSLDVGSLTSMPANTLLLNNPVLRQPLLRNEGAWYFFLAPTAFGHSALDLLETALAIDDEIWTQYLGRRGAFLEERTASVLASMLPRSTVYRNVGYIDAATGRVYESDIVGLLDSFALVTEC
jgi:hypothetical protein